MENFNLTLDAAFWITVAAIVALLLMSAFFSGSETALTAASRGKFAQSGGPAALVEPRGR